MSHHVEQDERESLLLELIGGRTDIPSAEQLGRLSEADWEAIARPIRQHRLEPLLHWRLTQDKPALAPLVPEKFRTQFAEAFRRSALRSLLLQRELIQICTLLEQAGIDCIALKGAYLAYFVYPHPALRPMRDLDILVRPEVGIQAFNLLLEKGYTQSEITPGDPEAYIQLSKHYPILIGPSGISIEIHTRISENRFFMIGDKDLALDEQVWKRSQTKKIGSTPVRFLSNEDLLFHLSVHGIVNHKMSCGPLFLSDIHYLLDATSLDFNYLIPQAQKRLQNRVITLTLQLHKYYNDKNAGPYEKNNQSNIPSSKIENIAGLMLADLDYRGAHLHDTHNSGNLITKGKAIIERIFPSPLLIRSKFPSSPGLPSLILAYQKHWLRTFGTLMPNYLSSKFNLKTRENIKVARWMENWLNTENITQQRNNSQPINK